MLIKKYSNSFKKCDKCGLNNKIKGILIYRVCFMIHFPYYSYFGFDLCSNCLKKLEKNLGRWLNIDVRGLKK